ncbi:A33 protein, partial [Amia calva]|nr:A33 protein [Amia calva]
METKVQQMIQTGQKKVEEIRQLVELSRSYPSLCNPPQSKDWTDINFHNDSSERLHKAVTEIKARIKEELKKLEKREELDKGKQVSVDVTLDPNTAHPSLILSEDGKQVRLGDKRQALPDNPERFNPVVSVLGKEGFSSGRHYWEVEVGEKTDWDLGVARESINRKGEIKLSPKNGYWTVWLRNGNEYQALADPSVLLPLSPKPRKVGVFVDYEGGQVSFYNVEARSHIYTFTDTFTEKLYPYFSPSTNEGGKNAAPLIISPVRHTD